MNIKKVLIVLLLIITLFFVCADAVFAYSRDEVESMIKDTSNVDTDVSNKITKAIKVILDVVRIAGLGIAMIMIVSFGVKYMATMPTERAQMMKQSMVYLLGAVLLFGASIIVGLISKIVATATEE